jgi:uncharacterized protein YciI
VKYALIYETAPDGMSRAAENFPAHRARYEAFHERGTLLMVGPFTDRSGALSVFTTREAAEEFAREDPFVVNGVIGKWEIHEWNEVLAP